jgi:hypothetical protein
MATFKAAEDFYYTQLAIEKKSKDYKDQSPSDTLKTAIKDWVDSCTTVDQADNVFYTARKHNHYVSEANAKKYALQQAKDTKRAQSGWNPKNWL